jgi:hypothetical protein
VLVDVHAHVLSPALIEQVRAGRWADGLALQESDGRVTRLVESRSRGAIDGGLLDVQQRLSSMDAAGIEVQLLSAGSVRSCTERRQTWPSRGHGPSTTHSLI